MDVSIESFERNFVDQLCPGHYAIFCSTGTAGLHSAYFALGLENEAEVLVPTNTFRATVTPLLQLNLTPVFCDSNPITGAIDLEDAEKRITSQTKALVVTHIWGHPADMDKAVALSKKYKLFLIEDCSHAHGARYNGQPVGTFGDVSVFSLGTKKMISGGLGGIIVTKNKTIYEKAMLFGQPSPVAAAKTSDNNLRSFLGSGFGVNYRGSPLAAIIASEHLARLEYTIATKNHNIEKLR
ncbi:MAG: DegT/DnrJ/EryC1/StrS family aminotransferase, partial [Candidatus Nanopelagicales bacterium]